MGNIRMKKINLPQTVRLSLILICIFGMFFSPLTGIAITLITILIVVVAYPFWQKFKAQRVLVLIISLMFLIVGVKILIAESATNKTAPPVKNNLATVDGLIDDYLRDSLCNNTNVVLISLPPDSSIHIDGLSDGTYSIVVPVNDSALSKILK
jgi:hypothetical protein